MNLSLHMHTQASDGILSIEEMLNRAVNEEIDYIAVSDHDVLNPRKKFDVLKGTKIQSIYSVEVTSSKYYFFHILGFGIVNDKYFNYVSEFLKAKKQKLNLKYLKFLESKGAFFTKEEIFKAFNTKYLDLFTTRNYLIKKGFASNSIEAFHKYMNPYFVTQFNETSLDAKTIVRLLKAIGCCVVLAHPSNIGHKVTTRRVKNSKLDKIVKELKDCGLDGIEVYNGKSDRDNIVYLSYLADKYDLIRTEGADFHIPIHSFTTPNKYIELDKFLNRVSFNNKNYNKENVKIFHEKYMKKIMKKYGFDKEYKF